MEGNEENPNFGINYAFLKTGEDISMRGYKKIPYQLELGKIILREILGLNGNMGWVANSPVYNQSGGRFYCSMSRVFVIKPSNVPHLKMNLKVPADKLPSPKQALEKLVGDFYKDVGIPPFVNGFLIATAKGDIGEPIRDGEDAVITGHKAILSVELLRYVPATVENRDKLVDVFGEVFRKGLKAAGFNISMSKYQQRREEVPQHIRDKARQNIDTFLDIYVKPIGREDYSSISAYGSGEGVPRTSRCFDRRRHFKDKSL